MNDLQNFGTMPKMDKIKEVSWRHSRWSMGYAIEEIIEMKVEMTPIFCI
jgi:hypothetical protein